MNSNAKRILIIAAAAALPLLIAGGLALRLMTSAKPRVAAIAADALGMEVTIRGPLTVRVRHGLEFALRDVTLRRCGVDVAAVAEADLGIALLPLLHGEIRVDELRLTAPQVIVVADGDAARRAGTGCAEASDLPALALPSVIASGAMIRYTDSPSGKFIEGNHCDVVVRDLTLGGVAGRKPRQGVSLAAEVTCGEVRTRDLAATDVTFTVAGRDGVVEFDPVVLQLLGGRGSGALHADFTAATPRYRARFQLAKFRLEEFFNALSKPHAGQGSLDFAATLSLSGSGPDDWLRTLDGSASLRGADLLLAIGDLDQKFARYESSQNFNLVDVGAVFFLGPIGLGITKGLDFARNLQGGDGDTRFKTLLSEWRVERGVAHATDVAMTTAKNRIALKGGLDFVAGRFDDVTVALVDARGCVEVRQRVTGPFLAPNVEEPNVLRSLTGPTRRLLGKVGTLLGAKCDVFYAGSVPPPQP